MEIMKPKKIRTTKLNIRIRMTMRTQGIILTQRSKIRILRIDFQIWRRRIRKRTRNQNDTKPEDQKEHINQKK